MRSSSVYKKLVKLLYLTTIRIFTMIMIKEGKWLYKV